MPSLTDRDVTAMEIPLPSFYSYAAVGGRRT